MKKSRNIISVIAIIVVVEVLFSNCTDSTSTSLSQDAQDGPAASGVNTGTKFDQFVSDFIANNPEVSNNKISLDTAGWKFGTQMAKELCDMPSDYP